MILKGDLKGDLKGFQENSETFFKSICHDLTPVNLKARRDKSYAHVWVISWPERLKPKDIFRWWSAEAL